MNIACPDAQNLVRLGTPAVGDATYKQYDEHIEGCPACQAVLRDFVDDGLHLAPLPESSLPADENFPRIPGFAIERKLGSGAMGVVYLARQDEIGRLVALKLVPGGHVVGERERRRWLREAKAASQVRHPHVVTLYGFGEAAPWSYLVLEFVPGGTLKSRLTGPLPPRDAARLVETVARAVHMIHEGGIYHLDLKPSNILLDADEDMPWNGVIPKVSDFGIARLAGDSTTSLSSGMPFGTPAYMAPEQSGMANGPVGPATDVYALGAILYELVTGRPPIQRISVAETLAAICSQEPISPRRLNPAISRDLETICLKCLQKDPGQRYVSAETLADDLRLFVEERPIRARPVSSVEHAWRWCRRNPVVAGLRAGLALAAVCCLAGLIILLKEARAGRRDAETNYRHAETNYQIASDALSDAMLLTGLVTPGAAKPDDDYVLTSLTSIRRCQQQLYHTRKGDRVAAIRLVRINMALADQLINRRKFVVARPIVEECLEILATSSTTTSNDQDALSEEIRCHNCLSELCWHAAQFNEALSHGVRACGVVRLMEPECLTDEHLRWALLCHVRIGELFFFKLDRAHEAKNWLNDHRRWLDAQASREPTHPFDLGLYARWLIASGHKLEALAFLRTAVRSHTKDVSLDRILAVQLIGATDLMPTDADRKGMLDEARRALVSVMEPAELAAANDPRNVDVLSTFGYLHHLLCHCLMQLGRPDEATLVFKRLISVQQSLYPSQRIDPGAADEFWREVARTALIMKPFLGAGQTFKDFVCTTLNEMHFNPRSEGELGHVVILAEGDLAPLMRRTKRQNDAEQIVEQMLSYARELVARNPNDPLAYLALSEAHIQLAKNADRYDPAEQEPALRQALDSAERAYAINPASSEAQAAVADRRRRLERIKAAS